MAKMECQHQFRHSRWNCSGSTLELNQLQKRKATQEVAFLQALTPAAVNYAVSFHCANSKSRGCKCDNRNADKIGNDTKGVFRWGGCSLDLKKGRRFAMAVAHSGNARGSDAVALMVKHNIRVGRKAVKEHETLSCRCHGISGSCGARLCWKSLRVFRDLGDYMKKEYDKAVLVTMSQDGTKLVPKGRPWGRVSKNHLVYLEDSPDFCSPDPDFGALGTNGRECSRNESDPNSCKNLCCGHGYDTLERVEEKQCNCTFIYCCRVECEMCKVQVTVHTCKTHSWHQSLRLHRSKRP